MTLKHLRNLVKLTRRIERLNLGSVLKSVLSGKRVPHINNTFTKNAQHAQHISFYTVCIDDLEKDVH